MTVILPSFMTTDGFRSRSAWTGFPGCASRNATCGAGPESGLYSAALTRPNCTYSGWLWAKADDAARTAVETAAANIMRKRDMSGGLLFRFCHAIALSGGRKGDVYLLR